MFKPTFFASTLAVLATTGALLNSPALAATETTATPVPVSAKAELPDRADWMGIKNAHDALEKAGYKEENIKSIITTRQGYMASALNAENQKVRLVVHPTEGTVSVAEKRKHRKAQRHHSKE